MHAQHWTINFLVHVSDKCSNGTSEERCGRNGWCLHQQPVEQAGRWGELCLPKSRMQFKTHETSLSSLELKYCFVSKIKLAAVIKKLPLDLNIQLQHYSSPFSKIILFKTIYEHWGHCTRRWTALLHLPALLPGRPGAPGRPHRSSTKLLVYVQYELPIEHKSRQFTV